MRNLKFPNLKFPSMLVPITLVAGLLLGMLIFALVFYFRGTNPPVAYEQLTPTTQQQPATPVPSPSNGPGQVFPYETLPGAQKSPITVNVNGQDIFVERYKHINYARFAFTGTAQVSITSPDADRYTISPRSYNIQATQDDHTTRFALNRPSNLILQNQDGDEKLFLFADAPEQHVPQPADANVIDVSKYVTDRSGKTVQTTQIQSAINEASNRHAIVYFPRGIYTSGTLKIKNNASLYLSSGALLNGSSHVGDFDKHFLVFDHTSNAKIYGPGVIDLHGIELRGRDNSDGRIKIIRTIGANNIEISNVLLRDAGSWTVHLVGSNNVKVNNLKIINDLNNTNGDGIDPDGSQNVTIDHAFLYTSDDCFAVKTSGLFDMHEPSSNIMIKNSVCYTKKSALKVGTETRAMLSHITFQNNDVVHADRAIALYMEDGNIMQDINYINNTSEEVGGNSKQRLIDIRITDRAGIGQIKDVEIRNYTAYEPSPKASAIEGLGSHNVDVVIKNMTIAGQPCTNTEQANIKTEYANVTFSAGS